MRSDTLDFYTYTEIWLSGYGRIGLINNHSSQKYLLKYYILIFQKTKINGYLIFEIY